MYIVDRVSVVIFFVQFKEIIQNNFTYFNNIGISHEGIYSFA